MFISPRRIIFLLLNLLLHAALVQEVHCLFGVNWPHTKFMLYRGRARPVRNGNGGTQTFRPYKYVIDQKPAPVMRPRPPRPPSLLHLNPFQGQRLRRRWRRFRPRPQQQRGGFRAAVRRAAKRRSDHGGEDEIIEEEVIHDTHVLPLNNNYEENEERENNDYEDEEEETPGDIHIHLKSLLDSDLVNYLVSEIPWEDLLSRNKLTHTQEVRYTSESLIEEGNEEEDDNGYAWQRDHSQGEDWAGDDQGERHYASETDGSLEHNDEYSEQQEDNRDIGRTHEILVEDCPYYFQRYFPHAAAARGIVRTSLLGYMECEKEKNLGSDPFSGGYEPVVQAQPRQQQQQQGGLSWRERNVRRQTRRRRLKSPVERRLTRFRNYVKDRHGQ